MECKYCLKFQPLTAFYPDKTTKTGYKTACKACLKNKRTAAKRGGIIKAHADPTATTVATKSQPEPENLGAVMTSATEAPKAVEGPGQQHEASEPQFRFEDYIEEDKHYSIVMCAARNSGKTTILQTNWDVLESKFDIIVLFSESLNAPIYKTFVKQTPNILTFKKFKPEVLRELEQLQNQTDNYFRICIIFDDCIDLNKNKNNNMMIQLYTRGRNMGMTIIFSTQTPIAINPSARANIDALMLLNNRNAEMRTKIIEKFLWWMIPIPEQYRSKSQKLEYLNGWLDARTRDYRAVVIDFLHGNQVMWYKSDERKILK